nr:MetaGeneMark_Unknown Function [uncultured bacterium]
MDVRFAMSFSEDSATPAAPFTGDGSVFDQPDVVFNLPTTSERVVDTQSGFLLVIRRLGDRLAMTCKRRVGTPPSSAILLTPDETIKLSRALSASVSAADEAAESGRFSTGGRRRMAFNPPTNSRRAGVLTRLRKPALGLLAFAILGGSFATGLTIGRAMSASPKQVVAAAAAIDPLSSEGIDKFTRIFVGEMLDFNPETYKRSQIQAMSAMAPDLLEKYWKETNFPLAAAQLKTLPQASTVIIDTIDQQLEGKDTASVVVSAQIVRADAKLGSAVKLKLKLGLNKDGAIQVLEQQDLASGQN